jgi:uncharacterized protein (DUF362 family)
MSRTIDRRSFLKAGALVSLTPFVPRRLFASVLPGNGAFPAMKSAGAVVSIVKGSDYYKATIKALDLLGGMKQFVSRNATVGLLVNSRYDKPGTFVKPEITLAVLKMCMDAGASSIYTIEGVSRKYWDRSELSGQFIEEIRSIKPGNDRFADVEIPKGVSLKKAEIARAYLDCDVLINIPIVKDHEGIRTTGSLKNIMGATSHTTNRYFHLGSGASGYYDDVQFLSQCIADANLLRRPTLCVMDATEFITTNGPFGPGKVAKIQKVIAGSDPVAVDSVGVGMLGLNANDIVKIHLAYEHGLGQMNKEQITVKEGAI